MNPQKSRYYTYIKPIIKNKFARTYSSLIFSLITIAIFSYYAIRPTVTTILSLQKSIQEQNQVLLTLKEKVNNLVAGKKNYEDIPSATKDKMDSLVPNNPNLAGLINSLSYVADNAQASISGIQFQPVLIETVNSQPSKNAQLSEVAFAMNVQGEFPNLMNLLTTLKRLDRLVTLSTVNFVQPVDAALVMSITGKAYYIKN
jgi:Tfp pilus assembly protein PilO